MTPITPRTQRRFKSPAAIAILMDAAAADIVEAAAAAAAAELSIRECQICIAEIEASPITSASAKERSSIASAIFEFRDDITAAEGVIIRRRQRLARLKATHAAASTATMNFIDPTQVLLTAK